MRESQVERHLVAAARKLGGQAIKWTAPGTAGVPDRIVLLPCGCTRLVELKAENQKPRPLQLATFAKLAAINHPVTVLDSVRAVDEWIAVQASHVNHCRT